MQAMDFFLTLAWWEPSWLRSAPNISSWSFAIRLPNFWSTSHNISSDSHFISALFSYKVQQKNQIRCIKYGHPTTQQRIKVGIKHDQILFLFQLCILWKICISVLAKKTTNHVELVEREESGNNHMKPGKCYRFRPHQIFQKEPKLYPGSTLNIGWSNTKKDWSSLKNRESRGQLYFHSQKQSACIW